MNHNYLLQMYKLLCLISFYMIVETSLAQNVNASTVTSKVVESSKSSDKGPSVVTPVLQPSPKSEEAKPVVEPTTPNPSSSSSLSNQTTLAPSTDAAEPDAAPEFEDRPNPIVEGGKAETEEEEQKKVEKEVAPPPPQPEEGDGKAKEDVEVNVNDNLNKMVEDAKGNVAVEENNGYKLSRFRVDQPEDSNFLTFIVLGAFLVFCIYLLQHNKKKILGLIFEGRSSRNVRYRRLSQRDDAELQRENIIY